MKYILIIWVCSFVEGNKGCLPPVQHPKLFDSWYECSRAAHQESIKIMSKMGYKLVNEAHVAMKYRCTAEKVI